MSLKPYQKAANAIRWINPLPDGKQAPMGKRRRLGDTDNGFCCLGYGCHVLGVDFIGSDALSAELVNLTGLLSAGGTFKEGRKFYKLSGLADINDMTNAGFKRIARLMRTKPHWMFDADVADLIQAYYEMQEEAA